MVAVRFAFLYLISLLAAAAAAAPHPAVAPHAPYPPIFLSLYMSRLAGPHLTLVCKVALLSSLAITSRSLSMQSFLEATCQAFNP